MDPEWVRALHWALSVCPRLYRYIKAVIRYMGTVPLPKIGTGDDKKMQEFLLATAAVLKELKRCGARPAAIDGALENSVMVVQLQLEAMQLRQRLTVACLRTKLARDPAMPATATAVLVIAPAPLVDSPATACTAANLPEALAAASAAACATFTGTSEPVTAVSMTAYSGADRRKRC
jgi:hypothetical protein